MRPPAVPVNTPMKDVAKEANVRPKNSNGPTSGVMKKSMSILETIRRRGNGRNYF
jgi:hypothetical protein